MSANDTETEGSYTTAFPAITEVLSRETDNLVLLFGSSNEEEINALAFKIRRTGRRFERYRETTTLDADGNSGDTLGFGILGEDGHGADTSSPGDDILQIENRRDSTLVEYGFAVEPDGVYVGVETANNSSISGLREGSDRLRQFGVDTLASRGGVLSDYTRTAITDELPTTALSSTEDQGVFRIDSDESGKNPIRLAFDNTTASQVDVDVTAVGRTYQVEEVVDSNAVVDMVSPGGTPARVVTYGGFANQNPNLPPSWQQAVTSISEGEIGFGG